MGRLYPYNAVFPPKDLMSNGQIVLQEESILEIEVSRF
jgi:hypothetical protein